MSNDNGTRKIGDVLLSLEEKITLLIKAFSANDMNNKLILDRLNKLISQGTILPVTPTKTLNQIDSKPEISSIQNIELSSVPSILNKRDIVNKKIEKLPDINKSDSKIPVGQRVKDTNGKDFFYMDVLITNLSNGSVVKAVTNPVGKWHAQLEPGKYSLKLFSNSSNPDEPSEYADEFEITNAMKSLQLPVAVVKR